MSWVADYSAARPGGAGLKAAGATGVMRYAGAITTEFNITKAEVADLTDHGIPIGIVVERRITDILGGAKVGNTLALAALETTRAAGLPDGMLYVAGDDDLTLGGPTTPGSRGDVQMGRVADTLSGVAGVVGWPHVGFYGSYYAIDWLIAKAVPVAAYWQTEAWSGGKVHPRAALLQRATPQPGTPLGCDYNDIHGDWHPRTATPPPQENILDTRTLQQHLVRIGWPITVDGAMGPQTRSAVEEFQNGYGRAGIRLAVDGVVGPKTQAAMNRCLDEDGRLSAHFYFREFADHSNGWIKVHWSLPTALEQYRAHVSPGGVNVVSGHRTPAHNAAIGGASNSQHIYGTAADIAPIATLKRVRGLGIFSGIEYRGADQLVYHVDTRAQGPNNTTRSSNANPSVFPWG